MLLYIDATHLHSIMIFCYMIQHNYVSISVSAEQHLNVGQGCLMFQWIVMYISSYALYTHLFIKLPETKVYLPSTLVHDMRYFWKICNKLDSHYWCSSPLGVVWWMQVCVFQWLFLVTSEIEHTSVYLLALGFLFCVNCILRYPPPVWCCPSLPYWFIGVVYVDWTWTLCLYVWYFPKLSLVFSLYLMVSFGV